jgi:DNA-binding NarL/FixJ family response regulator
MPRVLLVGTESVLCERLRQAFQSHAEFEICGGVKTGAGTLKKAIEPRPDLVVWRWQAIHSAVLRPPKN